MKRFFPLLALFLSLPAMAVFNGGMSGGGGNIIAPIAPTSPVDPETSEHLVYHSYHMFLDYIGRKKAAFTNGDMSPEQRAAFAPIFNAEKSIECAAQKVHLLVLDNRPCRDAQQNPVDGSTITDSPNSICISAYNIGSKTDIGDISPQSAALMLHEYSEVIGVSESDAVRAQTEALKELRGL